MSWLFYNTNPSSAQEQIRETLEEQSSIRAQNIEGISDSECAMLEPLFEDLGPFTSDYWQTFDFPYRFCSSDTIPSKPGNLNTSPILKLQPLVQEINTDGVQKCNRHDHRQNKDKERTTPFESSLLCHWPGCKHPGPFSTKGSLKRHINTQHVAPGSFKCHPCNMSFNRKDNLDQHLRKVHRDGKNTLQRR